MGTRGLLAFHTEALTTLTYNHYDSYPGGLGLTVLGWLRNVVAEGHVDRCAERAATLRHVEGQDACDPEYLALAAANGVSTGSDWYAALREDQGHPGAILDRGIVVASTEAWPADSLFCEWGYVIDFEKQVLETYQGFQREPHQEGRFAHLSGEDGTYHPIRLVVADPFAMLPTDEEYLDFLRRNDPEAYVG